MMVGSYHAGPLSQERVTLSDLSPLTLGCCNITPLSTEIALVEKHWAAKLEANSSRRGEVTVGLVCIVKSCFEGVTYLARKKCAWQTARNEKCQQLNVPDWLATPNSTAQIGPCVSKSDSR